MTFEAITLLLGQVTLMRQSLTFRKGGNKMQVTWATFQELNEDNIRKNVPEMGGVYLLWVKLKNGKWKCFYVGKANELQARLLYHCSLNEENDCIKNKVQNYVCGYEYAKVAKQADRAGSG